MFPKDILFEASYLLDLAAQRKKRIVTAESCTGGLVVAALTCIPGAAKSVETGFVTYSNAAKTRLLQVPENILEAYGAVSEPVARLMAEGALTYAPDSANIAISVTGIAGPDGGTLKKPVGLVHFACAQKDKPTVHVQKQFPDEGRHAVQLNCLRQAFALLSECLLRE